jgi:hypothetical protein
MKRITIFLKFLLLPVAKCLVCHLENYSLADSSLRPAFQKLITATDQTIWIRHASAQVK